MQFQIICIYVIHYVTLSGRPEDTLIVISEKKKKKGGGGKGGEDEEKKG